MRPVFIIILIVFGLIVAFSGCSTYNGFVDRDVKVEQAWADVETQYQRRVDLIDNLVETVKGSANFEKSTLTEITQARAKATSMTIDPTNATPEQLAEFQKSQGELSSALGRLLMITENYPDLKTTEAFRDLTVQLEGTENRVAVARRDFNAVVSEYNMAVRRFPANAWAGLFGFSQKAMFQADEGAENAPKVKFD